jgi:hypothetical protein
MIHIDFSGSNGSCIGVFQADAGRRDSLDTVCIRPEHAEYLMTFIQDIREMPDDQWQQVMKAMAHAIADLPSE